ncbi:MAG: metallophosphoesterase family protein [Cytophagales bacterium]|uniref:metallophosphoesterase family protein n=1 Tax=Cyclobacterium marinum TaxID=104 RepID=UPI0030DC9B30|nr:metallophosphoesterase family protein [Cytophagales bacterium]|tara:strand:- start:17833 stop:19161 length:1329 start_codon:yes stop_codon:yes gene_type:complete
MKITFSLLSLIISWLFFSTPMLSTAQSAEPEHIVLTWKKDPSHSQSVTWRTSLKLELPIAQVSVASSVGSITAHDQTYQATIQEIKSLVGKSYYYYSVTFEGLKPGRIYRYRVGEIGNKMSEWNQFTTADNTNAPYSFIYLGDIQNEVLAWGSRTIRAAYAKAPKAGFMLFAGDLINDGHQDSQWIEWFESLSHIRTMKSIVPVIGNHEYDTYPNDPNEEKISMFWRPQFELPLNGPKGLEESVYYMDYKNMRLVVLNSLAALKSPEDLQVQSNYLDKVLADNPQKWTVVSFHHPFFTARDGRHGNYPELREAWQPILEKYKVDLVLKGHDHVYARGAHQTKTIDVPDGQVGPVYVVSVAGPKMYGIVPEKRWMDRAAVNTQLYQVITIDGDLLQYRAYTVLDELYDAFDLQKQNSSFNLFTEHISTPKYPENSFPNGSTLR